MLKQTCYLVALSCLFLGANAVFGPWSDWSPCSQDMMKSRTRECLAEPCIDVSIEIVPCDCDPIDIEKSCSEVCHSSECISPYVADPCDKRCYFACVKVYGNWTGRRQCCNRCEMWDDDLWTCVFDRSDPNCTFTATTKGPDPCPLSPGSTPTTYILGGEVRPCSPGTVYSQAACGCVLADPQLLPEAIVKCITFDGPRPYFLRDEIDVLVSNVEIIPNCGVSGNCGYFNREKKAHLELPYFINNQFEQLTFSFWYKRTHKDAYRMGLLHNGNCKLDPTISLVSYNNTNCGRLETENMSYNKKSAMAVDDEWHMYTMSYNGSYVSVYEDGVLFQDQQLTGMTKRTKCPLTIGSYLCSDYYEGHMDSIAFFRVGLTATEVHDMFVHRGACAPSV